ncbi:hypothetical protein NQ318_002613 [Aromia moschata]|uniref:Transposase n=1 Tax=Aromia moschata TaxID=1265417 RepID=A0AAV8XYK1_9CUCU|nr:hypothetical protein NQ318_002613 [Aromia moschata]
MSNKRFVLTENSHEFRTKISGVAAESQGTVSKIEKQFRERGHVRQLKKNPPNKLSDDQKLDVMLMLEENPHTSSRQTAAALNISHSPILRVLTENQMHPYKLVPTNELPEDDFDRRFLFCELMMQLIDDNTLQIENILFSDESTFTLLGKHDRERQNCRYWSSENLHWMRELQTQNPEKINVWIGIIGENIIGPFFIDGDLNGETYLALLQNNVVATIRCKHEVRTNHNPIVSAGI